MDKILEKLWTHLPEYIIEESQRIWPDASLAFDVPSPDILEDYLSNPNLLEEDLKYQIEKSPNCLRALKDYLEDRRFLDDQKWDDDAVSSILDVLNSNKNSECPVNISTLSSKEETIPTLPGAFEVWSTQSEIPYFDENSRERIFKNYNPRAFSWYLTKTLYIPGYGGFHLQRRPCIRGREFPSWAMDSEQIAIKMSDGRLYVLHLSMNFPVSKKQLDAKSLTFPNPIMKESLKRSSA